MKSPKKPAARKKPLYVRLRPEEHKIIQDCAWAQGKGVSEWVRDVLLNAARGVA